MIINKSRSFENINKSSFVQTGFSEIAHKYDLFNDLVTQRMHRIWKRYLIQQAGLKLGGNALDICCGTGDILEGLANEVGSQGFATGLDFSSGMLDVAKTRSANGGKLLLQGDAMSLPIKSESLNAVTVGFGLRNLDNLETTLEEVYRVLKPGGRFLCLDMGKVKIPIIKSVFNFYFFHIVPIIGKILCPGQEMFDYFPKSTLNYPSQEKLAQILSKIGFSDVRFRNFNFGAAVVHVAIKAD